MVGIKKTLIPLDSHMITGYRRSLQRKLKQGRDWHQKINGGIGFFLEKEGEITFHYL